MNTRSEFINEIEASLARVETFPVDAVVPLVFTGLPQPMAAALLSSVLFQLENPLEQEPIVIPTLRDEINKRMNW